VCPGKKTNVIWDAVVSEDEEAPVLVGDEIHDFADEEPCKFYI